MKKWWYWLILSGIWVVAGVINFLEGRALTAALPPFAVFLFLALSQLICERRGEKGLKAFRYITLGVLALVALFLVTALAIAFVKNR